MFNFTKKDIFNKVSSEEINQDTEKELYFAKVAYEHLGSAIRDNCIVEIVELGETIENGPFDEFEEYEDFHECR